MKSKLIMLFLLVLISLSISSVCASDIDNSTIPEDSNNDVFLVDEENMLASSLNDNLDDSIISADDNDTLSSESSIWYVNGSVSASGNGSQENPYKTFNEVVDNADVKDGDTIMIAPGIYTGAGENVNLTIKTALNIVNWTLGDVIFDAEQNSRIFTVEANSFNITGITFKNGKSRYGGAICFENAITHSIFNGTFIDNYVENETNDSVFYAKGGAIFFADTVDNCIFDGSFINNTIFNDDLEFDGKGGAIFFADMVSNAIFVGTFINNTVSDDGGALCFNDTVVDSSFACNFSGNLAFDLGSSIYINKNVKNTTFQCSAIEDIGNTGLLAFNGDVSDCDFNMEIIDYNGANPLCFLRNVCDCSFDGTYINSRSQNGGVFYFLGNVSNCKFNGTYKDNFAFENGGVFYFANDVINCTIDGVFDKNIAQVDGSVVYMGADAQDCIFNGTYDNCQAQYGGVFYIMDGAQNCIFDGVYMNNYGSYGGVSIVNGAVNCTFTGLYINNTGENLGGTHYFKGNVVNSTITGVYTDNKVLNQDGGALFFKANFTDSTINGVFINNSANGSGAIYFLGMVDNCTFNGSFINNTVSGDGAALCFNDTVVDSSFACNFSGNIAPEGRSGAIYIDKDVKNTTFQCSAVKYFDDDSFVFNGVVTDCDFNMYVDGYQGDVPFSPLNVNHIDWVNSPISFLSNVSDCTFNGTYINNVLQEGGAFYFLGNVSNCKFNGTYKENYVFENAGVFYFANDVINCTIDGVFDKNQAFNEASIFYMGTGAQDCIFNGTYTANGKSQFGGLFYVMDEAKNCIIDGVYKDNSALYGGVSIFNDVVNCTFTGLYINNTGENLGGTHYFKGNVVNSTITGMYIDNKVVEQNGGALFFKVNFTDSTIGGIFINNSARNGSAIYFGEVNDVLLSGKYINNTGNSVIHVMKANGDNIVHDSIFINNDKNILSVESGKLQSVNNWFGNNATNYNDKPEAVNVDMDNWLFLNATSNPCEDVSDSTSIITFKLESYNETSNRTGDYGGSKMDIILDLSSTLGTLNQTIALINEDVLYTPSKKGNASITAKFENAYDTICLTNILNASMNVTADDITEGENLTVNVELPDDATGKVTATVDGINFTSDVVNGTAIITVPDLPAGNYTVPVAYSGDDKYDPNTKEINVTVNEDTSDIIIAPEVTKYYGGSERFVVTVTDYQGNPLANKTVKININGKDYIRTTDENGNASMAVGLPSNIYNVTVTVDNQTVKSVVTVLSTVNGTDVVKMYRNGTQYYATFLDSEGKYLDNGTTVKFNINGVMYERKVSGDNGLASLNINLPAGEYIITAINLKTGENAANNITVLPTLVENRDITKYYKNATQYTVKVLDEDGSPVGAGVNVKFNINGVFYTRQTDEFGIATLNINLISGDYIITAEYNGFKVANNITVLPVLSAEDITIKYDSGSQFVATLLDDQGKPYAEQKLQFNINGVLYYRETDSFGQAKLNINLPAGEYIITSSYNGANIANKITIVS